MGLASSASLVCSLCGVPRASMKAPVNIPSRSTLMSHSLSSSLPSSSLNLAKLSISTSASPSPSPPIPPGPPSKTGEIACVACTFLNNSLLRECEICGTLLPRGSLQSTSSHLPAKSAPTSRSVTPAPDEDSDDDSPDKRMIRISFRKGGDKAFYSVLRRCLLGKAWEVR